MVSLLFIHWISFIFVSIIQLHLSTRMMQCFPGRGFMGLIGFHKEGMMTSNESMRITHPESHHFKGVTPAPCWPCLCRASDLEGFSSNSLFTQIIIPTKPAQDAHLAPSSGLTSTCVNKPQWILTDSLMSTLGLWTLLGPESPSPRSSTVPNPPNAGKCMGGGDSEFIDSLVQAQHHVKDSTST